MVEAMDATWRWRLLHGLYAGLILAVSSVPGSDLPQEVAIVSDKALHFGEYAVLGLLGGWAYLRNNGSRLTLLLVFGLAFAGLDEFWQSTIPGRESDSMDILADLAGHLAGTFAVVFYCKRSS
jgi:VanZ family protein